MIKVNDRSPKPDKSAQVCVAVSHLMVICDVFASLTALLRPVYIWPISMAPSRPTTSNRRSLRSEENTGGMWTSSAPRGNVVQVWHNHHVHRHHACFASGRQVEVNECSKIIMDPLHTEITGYIYISTKTTPVNHFKRFYGIHMGGALKATSA